MRVIGTASRVIVLSAVAAASFCASAIAKDMEMLARLLIPAYMAQNFATLCVDQDAQFLSDLKGGLMLVTAFAEHVKQEVTTGLSDPEASEVRLTAADAARNVTRDEMQLLGARDGGVPTEALKRWCDRSAKHFITEIMAKHQEKHEEFDRLVNAAKH